MDTVFVYGTLKKGEPNHELIKNTNCGFARYLGTGRTIDSYPLVIASKFNIPYLLKQVGQGHHVRGEIYEVDDPMLAALDELEGHPKYYRREKVEISWLESDINQDKDTIKCWAYFLTNHKPFMLQLPCLRDYSSNGPHNLPYVPRYLRTDGHNPHIEVKDVDDLEDPKDI